MDDHFYKINPACFNSNLLLDNTFSGKMLQYEELEDDFYEKREKRIENFCFVFEFARRVRIQPEWEIRKKLYIKTMYMGTNFPDDIINMIITYLEPSKFFQNSSSDCSDLGIRTNNTKDRRFVSYFNTKFCRASAYEKGECRIKCECKVCTKRRIKIWLIR